LASLGDDDGAANTTALDQAPVELVRLE